MASEADLRAAVIRRLVIRTYIFLAILGLILFVLAGTVDWPAAWAYLGLSGVMGLGTGLLLAYVW